MSAGIPKKAHRRLAGVLENLQTIHKKFTTEDSVLIAPVMGNGKAPFFTRDKNIPHTNIGKHAETELLGVAIDELRRLLSQ